MAGVKAAPVDEFTARYMLVDESLQDHAASGQWSIVHGACEMAKKAGVQLEGLPELTNENIDKLQKNHAISVDDAARFRQNIHGGDLYSALERVAQQELARKVAEGQRSLREQAELGADTRVGAHAVDVKYDNKGNAVAIGNRNMIKVAGAADGEDIAVADSLHLVPGMKSGEILKAVENYLVHTNVFEKETAKGFLTPGTTMLADAERIIAAQKKIDPDTPVYAQPILDGLKEAAHAYQDALKNEMVMGGPAPTLGLGGR